MEIDTELRKFLDKRGKVSTWPAKPVSQMRVLRYLADKFVLGKIYSEKEVTVLLNDYHTFEDPALLRREMVIKGLLDRTQDGNTYWKTDVNNQN